MIQHESNRAQQVKLRFLREYNVKVIDEWLSGCVSFSVQENPKISNESLFQFAYNQWLLADLSEIGVASLPDAVDSNSALHTLNGTFPLQMQYLIDVSESAYDQWRNIYDKKLDEAEDEIQMRKSQQPLAKKKRMLRLELTDGKRTVVALEHSPIPVLNTKLTPGHKILLSGPLRCINKVILLESKNVRVLGGEVDVLLIPNAYENVLLKAMNKPLNPNPKLDYDELTVIEQRRNANCSNIKPIPMEANPTARSVVPPSGEDGDDDIMLLGINLDVIENSERVPHTAKPEQVPAITTLMDDDDDLDVIDVSYAEVMNQHVSSTKHSQTSSDSPPLRSAPSATHSNYDRFDVSTPNNAHDSAFNRDESWKPDAKRARTMGCMANGTQQPSTSKVFSKFSASSLFEDSLDCADFDENCQNQDSSNILSKRYEFVIDGCSLATVQQIATLPENDRIDGSFVVFCEIDAITEKIRIKDGQWHLGVMLSDGTDRLLSVQFHDTVIAKLVGHDAKSLWQMRKCSSQEVMKMLEQILMDLKNLLQELRCFMRLVYERGNQNAIVMETYNLNDERRRILLKKISKENCTHVNQLL